MYLRPGEKKALVIFVAVAVAFVAVVGGAVGYLVATSPDDDDRPVVDLAIGDELVRLEPSLWCSLYLETCDPPTLGEMQTPDVPIPIGETVLLSVPPSVASTPWRMVTQYLTPEGTIEVPEQLRTGASYTVPLRSRPDRVLVAFEIHVLSGIAAPDGNDAIPRGLITANTMPEEFDPATVLAPSAADTETDQDQVPA